MRAVLSWLKRGLGLLVLLLTGPAVAAIAGIADLQGDWRTASRDTVGIAPDPAVVRCGLPVEVAFLDVDDEQALPVFRPSETA